MWLRDPVQYARLAGDWIVSQSVSLRRSRRRALQWVFHLGPGLVHCDTPGTPDVAFSRCTATVAFDGDM